MGGAAAAVGAATAAAVHAVVLSTDASTIDTGERDVDAPGGVDVVNAGERDVEMLRVGSGGVDPSDA